MKVTVEMTGEEFAEFLEFRKAKAIDERAKNSLRNLLNGLSSLVLQAVGYDRIEADPNYEVEDSEALANAVDFAVSLLT